MTYTGLDRRLYNHNRSRPTTLYTVYTIIYSPQNTLKIHGRVRTMTSTGHDRRIYNQDRSLPTTLYTSYPVGSSPSEYTESTRSCTMTSTGHDRWLYN